MTPLYILGGLPYEATPSCEHGVIFRLVKAARRKPSPGQMALFDMPSKPKAPKRNKPKEGDTRVNRKGNKEVLRSGRWRLLEPKARAGRPSGAGLSILSEDAISTTKQPLRLRPKPSSVVAGAWDDALKPKLPSPLTLGDEDIFEPTPLTDDIDYAYNQREVDSRGDDVLEVDDPRSIADRRYAFSALPPSRQVELVGDRGVTKRQIKPVKEVKLSSDVPDIELYEDVLAELLYETSFGEKVIESPEKLSFVVRAMQRWGQVAGGDASDVFRPESVFLGADGNFYVSYGKRYFPLDQVPVNSSDILTTVPAIYIG